MGLVENPHTHTHTPLFFDRTRQSPGSWIHPRRLMNTRSALELNAAICLNLQITLHSTWLNFDRMGFLSKPTFYN